MTVFDPRIDPDVDRGAFPRGLVNTRRKPQKRNCWVWDVCWPETDGPTRQLNDLLLQRMSQMGL